jgi:hypothetical protein
MPSLARTRVMGYLADRVPESRRHRFGAYLAVAQVERDRSRVTCPNAARESACRSRWRDRPTAGTSSSSSDWIVAIATIVVASGSGLRADRQVSVRVELF